MGECLLVWPEAEHAEPSSSGRRVLEARDHAHEARAKAFVTRGACRHAGFLQHPCVVEVAPRRQSYDGAGRQRRPWVCVVIALYEARVLASELVEDDEVHRPGPGGRRRGVPADRLARFLIQMGKLRGARPRGPFPEVTDLERDGQRGGRLAVLPFEVVARPPGDAFHGPRPTAPLAGHADAKPGPGREDAGDLVQGAPGLGGCEAGRERRRGEAQVRKDRRRAQTRPVSAM